MSETPLYAWRALLIVTNLVVLDGKEDEAVRILLQERLIGLEYLDR